MKKTKAFTVILLAVLIGAGSFLGCKKEREHVFKEKTSPMDEADEEWLRQVYKNLSEWEWPEGFELLSSKATLDDDSPYLYMAKMQELNIVFSITNNYLIKHKGYAALALGDYFMGNDKYYVKFGYLSVEDYEKYGEGMMFTHKETFNKKEFYDWMDNELQAGKKVYYKYDSEKGMYIGDSY